LFPSFDFFEKSGKQKHTRPMDLFLMHGRTHVRLQTTIGPVCYQ
jgi:hypothetical protein